ncbi:MAG TPA: HEAT repeat domain-containing protein [Urbifossiella sp.]|nr:HEAT repeat domain-containing protein [Urbifossiella sp.]
MMRRLLIAVFAWASLASTGCVSGTWDAITSRRFRQEPFHTIYHLYKPEDPFVVLKADPPRDGDQRADAMRRLQEPLAIGMSQQEQDQIVEMLERTATQDASPVLRTAAITALGKFTDPRAEKILMVAYQNAHGRPPGALDPASSDSHIQLASGRRKINKRPMLGFLDGPTGYDPKWVTAIRCRVLESLGRTGQPTAVEFLAAVAAGPKRQSAVEGSEDRDVRLAAVRGLTSSRQPEAIAALAQVLAGEKGQDAALAGRAHEGLVTLTGKKLPPDPQQWQEVVQAGAVVAPQKNWVQNAFEWTKK